VSQILADETYLDCILAQCAPRARELASRTLAYVYDKVGFLAPNAR